MLPLWDSFAPWSVRSLSCHRESVVVTPRMKKAVLFLLAVLPCIASGSHLRTPKFEAELATKVGVHLVKSAQQNKTIVLTPLEAIHALRALVPSVNLNLEGQGAVKLLKNIASGKHTVLDPSESDYLGKYIIRHYGTMSSKLALQRHSNSLGILSHLDAAERPLMTNYGTIKPKNVTAPLVVDFTANDHVFDGLTQFHSATGATDVQESVTGASGGSVTGATGGSVTGATGDTTGSSGQEDTPGPISAATLVANTRLDRLKKNTTVASTEEEDDAADAKEDAEVLKNQTKSTQGTLVKVPTPPVNKLKDKIREIEEKLLGLNKATETNFTTQKKVSPEKTAGTAVPPKPDKPVVTAENVIDQLRKDKKGASQLWTRRHNGGVSVNHTLEPTRDDGRVNQFEWIKDGRMGSSVFRQYKQLKQMRRNSMVEE